MLTVIDAGNRGANGALMERAYRLRHEVFVEEMGWEAVRRPDGLERDRFDRDGVVEMVVEDEGRVVGYQRLLPTTEPYLLSDVYPQLCDGDIPRDPAIWEWTRFAVAKSHRGDGRSLGPVALELVTGFVQWGLACGVRAMIVEMTPVQLLRFTLCHFRAAPLGILHRIGAEEILAIRAEYDERTLARLHSLGAQEGVARRLAAGGPGRG